MNLRRELVYVLRAQRRDRLTFSFVVLTLALGIGANAAIFGIVDRLLLRGPEHVVDPSRVVRIYHSEVESGGSRATSSAFDFPAYLALRRDVHGFARVGAYSIIPATLGRGTSAQHATVGYVSGSLFSTLGTTAVRGRTLIDADDTPSGGVPAAMISHAMWRRDYGGADSALGQRILIDDAPYTIVGVAPAEFTGPDVGGVDVWLPQRVIGERLDADYKSQWDGPWVFVVARLGPGADERAVASQATAVFRHAYAGVDPGTAKSTISLASLTRNAHEVWSVEASVSASVLGLSLVVLAIACANVMNLLLARAARRRRETAVRVALGASASEIAAAFLLEGAVLAVIAGVAAAIVAAALSKAIWVWMLPTVEWPAKTMAMHVALAGIVATAVVGLVIGALLAFRMRGFDVSAALKAGDRGASDRSGLRQAILTISQCALSVVLLVAAGLFMRSLWAAQRVDYGIDTQGTYVVSVEWPRMFGATRPDDAKREWYRRREFLDAAATRLRTSPEIEDVAIAMGLPFRNGSQAAVRLANTNAGVPGDFKSDCFAVDAAYFATARTRVEQGRAFAATDDANAERVVILGRDVAHRLVPAASALNRCVVIGNDSLPCARVVGIVDDVRNLHGKDRPTFYVPLGQTHTFQPTLLLVRPRGHTSNLAAQVRAVLLSRDASVEYVDVRRLHDFIEPQLAPWELGSLLFGLMSILALTVAGVGLFGVVAYSTAARTREIGIRRALGAGPGRVLLLIVRTSMTMSAAGIAAGIVTASLATRFVRPLLFTATPNDPLVLVTVVVVLLTVALIAGAIPALRVNRRPPADALRAE